MSLDDRLLPRLQGAALRARGRVHGWIEQPWALAARSSMSEAGLLGPAIVLVFIAAVLLDLTAGSAGN